jgi:Fe-S oxidoreductase
MPYPINRVQLFSILKENQKRTGNPMGVSPDILSDWSKNEEFSSSSTIIYTGGLYQMMPKAEKFVDLMAKAETSSSFSFGLRVLGSETASGLAGRLVKEDKNKVERARRILRNASKLLTKNGVEHTYLGKDEPYSGILFYDLGLTDEFLNIATSCLKTFRERGVKKIITLDPHSTYALRELYPKFIDGFDLEVIHYMEITEPAKNDAIKDVYVIHDPCILSRRLSLSDAYRSYLDSLGVSYVEPERNRRITFCCGGPVESIAPAVSSKVSEVRCSQLRDKSRKAIAACPICLSNLGRCSRASQNESLEVFDPLELTSYG